MTLRQESQSSQDLGQSAFHFKIQELEDQVKILKDLCDHIDPYNELDSSTLHKLNSVGIFETHDPFSLTNQIIFKLENSLELLAKLKNENIN